MITNVMQNILSVTHSPSMIMMEFYSGVTNVITKVLLKSLSKHMTSNHYGEHFRCDKCDYHSAAKQSHERHTQYNHDGIKYTCGECDFKATQKQSLKTHIWPSSIMSDDSSVMNAIITVRLNSVSNYT